MGVVTTLIIIFISGWISRLYGYEIMQSIVAILSVNTMSSALVNVPNSIIIRNLEFKKILLQKIIILPISGFIGIMMALNGYGIWSLVTQQVIYVTGGSFILWFLSKWFPALSFDVKHIKSIYHFSAYLSLSKLVNYFTKKGDIFLIGKYIGSESLGIYSKCYQFTVQITKSINGVIIKVLYPSISKVKDNKKMLSKVFLSVSQVMLSLYSVIFLIGAMYSKELVYVVLGEKWGGVAPLIPVFLLLGLFLGMGSISSHFLKALGHAKLVFKIVFVSSVFTLISFVIGLQWGIMGVSVGYLFSNIILNFLLFNKCMEYLPIKRVDIATIFLKNIAAFFIIWLTVGMLMTSINIEKEYIRLLSGVSSILFLTMLYNIVFNTLEWKSFQFFIGNKV